jgi:hypothetical protein
MTFLTFNVFSSSEQKPAGVCMSSWRYPSDCTSSCMYEASWKPSTSEADSIEFTVKQKTSKNNDDWIAIGFSENTKMVTTIIIILNFPMVVCD